MTNDLLLLAMLALVVINFALDTTLDVLNDKSARTTSEPRVSEFYEPDKYKKSIEYGSEKFRFGLLDSTLNFLIILAALSFGWFAVLDNAVRNYLDNELLISLGFIATLGIITSVINLPFALYFTFQIEAKYGFNKTTLKTFITDRIKGTLLSLAIGGPLLATIIYIYQQIPQWFWLIGWALVSSFSLFSFMFGTKIFLPLFNKLQPVAEGELRNEIENYCKSQGYAMSKLYVMDGSRRSTKANAFFSGMGRTKTIVLFDTLIEKLTTPQITAVLAHEIGHYKRKHTLSMFLLSNLQTFALFALLGWLLGNPILSEALGAAQPSFHIGILAFFLLFSPISLILGIIDNALSRRNEFEADKFAIDTYPDSKQHLNAALKTISTDSLANLTPHPWYVKVHYTHPPILERLAKLN
ncbi:MAG: M48 family metallopeptidase [Actinobacteria bacterium]|nr:M48 family metallopeptidase [Actinomycetota bacterium]